jgi:ABC-type oligopeptide transport system ATPase subunit
MILNDPRTLENSSVIVVRDLIKQFEKRKSKGNRRRLYTAVDHLNFYVQKGACFGLLGIEKCIVIPVISIRII